jgi:chromosome segregation ATPase
LTLTTSLKSIPCCSRLPCKQAVRGFIFSLFSLEKDLAVNLTPLAALPTVADMSPAAATTPALFHSPAMSQLFDGSPTETEEGRGGQIVKVVLQNFLCHAHLEVDFGARLNLIQGLNGSGKSAVLTGIVIGLGGSVADAQRGASLSSLVRQGQTLATVIVHLRNTGSEAYRLQVYGDIIIIERSIRADGSSSYRLKNAEGHVVSTRKQDLTSILEHFSIFVDNPVCVMTQEASRQFMGTASPREKYVLFEQCTQLNTIKTNLSEAKDHIKLMQSIITVKDRELAAMVAETASLEERYKAARGAQTLKQSLQTLQTEAIWAQIHERDLSATAAAQAITEAELILAEKQAEMSAAEATLAEARGRRERTSRELLTLDEATNRTNTESIAMAATLKRHKAGLRQAQQAVAKTTAAVESKAAVVSSLEAELRGLEVASDQAPVRDSADVRLELDQRAAAAVAAAEARVIELRAAHAVARGARDACYSSIVQDEQALDMAQTAQRAAHKEAETLAAQVRMLQASKMDRLRLYGDHMPELVRLVRQFDDWDVPPVGPLGDYILAEDKSWAPVIELALGIRLLSTFLVATPSDAMVLLDMCKSLLPLARDAFRRPQICCLQQGFLGRLYDNFESDTCHCSPHPTLFSCISVRHPDVANFILDQSRVHQVLLVPDRDAALTLSYQAPRNFARCYTLAGDEVYPHGRFYSNKNRRLGNGHILLADPDVELASLEIDLAQRTKESHGAGSEVAAITARQQTAQGRLKELAAGMRLAEKALIVGEQALDEALTEQRDLAGGLSGDRAAAQKLVAQDLALAKSEMERLQQIGGRSSRHGGAGRAGSRGNQDGAGAN